MEDIKDRLGEYKYNYFTNLQNYLDTELYFYGSIKRFDYISNSSDVDIIVITDNVKSMLSKIQTYLNISKDKSKKMIQQHSINDKGFITGNKIKYQKDENGIEFDLIIYDEKYRKAVLQNIYNINNFPLYIIIPVYILKILYYKLYLISRKIYIDLKNLIFDYYFNREFRYYNIDKAQVIMLDGV